MQGLEEAVLVDLSDPWGTGVFPGHPDNVLEASVVAPQRCSGTISSAKDQSRAGRMQSISYPVLSLPHIFFLKKKL